MKNKKCPQCKSFHKRGENFCSKCGANLIVHDETCNLCGLSCRLGPEGSPASGNSGLIGVVASGGYESTPGNGNGALDDCSSYEFSLCEFCLDWLFEQFRVPPNLSDYMHGGSEPEPWRPAAQRVREDKWRKQKDTFFAEHEKRANARMKKSGP